MAERLEFNVGDKVVYPAHGVGEVTAVEKQMIGGMDVKLYVVSFIKEKMILRIPVKRANISGLRHLSGDEELKRVIVTLKGRAKVSRGMWSRRAKEYESKINSGDIVSLAEVVRDLHKNVDDPDRSYSERVIYESAMDRLAGEIAAVEKIDHTQATNSLVKALKKAA